MDSDLGMVLKAANAAATWHSGQRRKGKAREPYVNHLLEVGALVADATNGKDAVLVAAALLHDAIEDAGVTRIEIKRRYGKPVADLVLEVTDNKALPKRMRKRLQVEQASGKSSRAKLIKLADKISNLRALAQSPPARWPVERKLAYVAWARAVAAGLRGVSPDLELQFDRAARNAQAAAMRTDDR